jgi:hypothetical protein
MWESVGEERGVSEGVRLGLLVLLDVMSLGEDDTFPDLGDGGFEEDREECDRVLFGES